MEKISWSKIKRIPGKYNFKHISEIKKMKQEKSKREYKYDSFCIGETNVCWEKQLNDYTFKISIYKSTNIDYFIILSTIYITYYTGKLDTILSYSDIVKVKSFNELKKEIYFAMEKIIKT